jgi:hypothetical protein
VIVVGLRTMPSNQCDIVTTAPGSGMPCSSVTTPVTSNVEPLDGDGGCR